MSAITFEILAPFDALTWFSTVLTLMIICMTMLITLKAYLKTLPSFAKCKNDPVQVIMVFMAGLLEPYEIHLFNFGLAGRIYTILVRLNTITLY